MLEKNLSNILFVGVDESGPGSSYEVQTAVFSINPSSILINNGHFAKGSRWYKVCNGRLSDYYSDFKKTDYSFCYVPKYLRKNLSSKKSLSSLVVTSLLKGKLSPSIDELHLFLDGLLEYEEKEKILESVCTTYNFPKERIKINSGPNFDKIYWIVNLADKRAYLLHSISKKRNSFLKNKHRRSLKTLNV